MRAIVAVDEPHRDRIVRELEDDGVSIVASLAGHELGAALRDADGARERLSEQMPGLRETLAETDVLVAAAARSVLTSAVVSACDRHGVRIVPLTARPGEARWARSFGLPESLSIEAEGWRIVDAARAGLSAPPQRPDGKVVAVWGPHGAPGRSTIATELAVELARLGGRASLVDVDTHAPSIAVALGLAEDSPGIAAACRKAEGARLDAAELTRISVPLGDAAVDVLTGLNRSSRWPELSSSRVAAVLAACRPWTDHTVVDMAASVERDEEIVSDLQGPRRNAATLAALGEADAVVAVASADPVGISRFLRAYSDLRAHIGTTPVHVVVNRLRGGALGIDARGQVRRTLSRYAGITDAHFVPYDAKAADAGLLAAQPVGEISPRSSLAQAVRRLAKTVAGGADIAELSQARTETVRSRRDIRRRAA